MQTVRVKSFPGWRELNGDRVHIIPDKLTGPGMQYSKRYYTEAFMAMQLYTHVRVPINLGKRSLQVHIHSRNK